MQFGVMDNARDSLIHALDYYTKYIEGHKNWTDDDIYMEYFSFLKMSVLLTHHAIELFMKISLSEVNELFIYENLSDNLILDIHAFKVKNKSKTPLIGSVLSENCNVKTIDYNTLVIRFSRIFNLSKDLSVALNYLGDYRNKIAHLGIEMPMEYYKVISAINGALKVIKDKTYNTLNLTIKMDDPIYEFYDYIDYVIEMGQSVEEEVWSTYYSNNFIILNNHLDDLISDLEFKDYLKDNSYEINIKKGKFIDSSYFSIDFNNTEENLSFTIDIKNKPFSDVSIFFDDEGYVFAVLDQKDFLYNENHRKCFYCYKSPAYQSDDEFEEHEFWKDDRREKKCNLYEFNYIYLVKCLKQAVEWVVDSTES